MPILGWLTPRERRIINEHYADETWTPMPHLAPGYRSYSCGCELVFPTFDSVQVMSGCSKHPKEIWR